MRRDLQCDDYKELSITAHNNSNSSVILLSWQSCFFFKDKKDLGMLEHNKSVLIIKSYLIKKLRGFFDKEGTNSGKLHLA